MTGSAVDDEIERMLVLSADRDWIVHRLGAAGRDQRRGQQRLVELGEQRPYHRVIGYAHADGASSAAALRASQEAGR